jgi:hypothetical protein
MSPTAKKKPKHNSYPWWAPRFWHGMRLGDWLGLLARNRFRLNPLWYHTAAAITFFAAGNSVAAGLQSLLYHRRVRETEIPRSPIFIIGHWRSGTTYLHELMALDERFNSPTTYQCFAPHHFLLSEWFVTRFFWFVVPAQRPMDNVRAGWQQPQEDEFALCSLGVPSPYLRMAFPNHPPAHMEYLDMEGLSPAELARWKEGLRHFLKLLSLGNPRRIVLKSPPHTGRIGVLREMFPDAKFVHIVRDPYAVVPSTIRLWESLNSIQGLQWARNDDVREYVFAAYDRMYGGFEKHRESIPPEQICDVRYEELVADPVGQLRRIYQTLELDDFAAVEPKLAAYASSVRDYQTNRHELPPDLQEEISRRWEPYIQKYGYASAAV